MCEVPFDNELYTSDAGNSMPHDDVTSTQLSFEEAISCLREGMVVCYPTETFFAVGCSAMNRHAVHSVYAAKRRPDAMPLPVIIGEREQLSMVTDVDSPLVHELTDIFWPGSLTILVTARAEVPTVLTGESGRVAVRLTPHPVARKLCNALATPLVSTSANVSGRPAVAIAKHLDPCLVAETAGVLDLPPYPAGGQASTLVEIVGQRAIRIVRAGAVSSAALQAAGCTVLP